MRLVDVILLDMLLHEWRLAGIAARRCQGEVGERDGGLRISAMHDGHVHLRWRIASAPGTEPWSFSFVTKHGAGEDLRRLADDLDTLLSTE